MSQCRDSDGFAGAYVANHVTDLAVVQLQDMTGAEPSRASQCETKKNTTV